MHLSEVWGVSDFGEDIGCFAHVIINIQYVSTLVDAHIYVICIHYSESDLISTLNGSFFSQLFPGITYCGCKALPPRLTVGIVQVESSSLVDVLGATSTAPRAAMKGADISFAMSWNYSPFTQRIHGTNGIFTYMKYLHEVNNIRTP